MDGGWVQAAVALIEQETNAKLTKMESTLHLLPEQENCEVVTDDACSHRDDSPLSCRTVSKDDLAASEKGKFIGFWKPVWPYSVAARHSAGQIEQRMENILCTKSSCKFYLESDKQTKDAQGSSKVLQGPQGSFKVLKGPPSELTASELSRRKEFVFSVKEGDFEMVRALLESGLNPNLRGSDAKVKYLPNYPCLLLAAKHGRHEVVELLLDSKADLLASVDDVTALSLAQAQESGALQHIAPGKSSVEMGDHSKTVKVLKSRILQMAADERNMKTLQQFLSMAIQVGWLALATTVVQQGLDVNFNNQLTADHIPELFQTPLMHACSLGREDMLSLLLGAKYQPVHRIVVFLFILDTMFVCRIEFATRTS